MCLRLMKRYSACHIEAHYEQYDFKKCTGPICLSIPTEV